jgi:hypothetical protein
LSVGFEYKSVVTNPFSIFTYYTNPCNLILRVTELVLSMDLKVFRTIHLVTCLSVLLWCVYVVVHNVCIPISTATCNCLSVDGTLGAFVYFPGSVT